MNIALIIAGGSGERMHQDVPKQFISINDKPIIVFTMEAFQKHSAIDAIAIVCIAGWETILWAYAKQFCISKLKYVIPGGSNGYRSIQNGVLELERHYSPNDIILIHDAIRPMVSPEIISDCIVVTREYGNAISCIPCAEAMLTTNDGKIATGNYPRDGLVRTQTPQGFLLKTICDVHRRSISSGVQNSIASCTLMIEMGEQVHFSKGSEKNIKLTTVDDLEIFKALLSSKRMDWLK